MPRKLIQCNGRYSSYLKTVSTFQNSRMLHGGCSEWNLSYVSRECRRVSLIWWSNYTLDFVDQYHQWDATLVMECCSLRECSRNFPLGKICRNSLVLVEVELWRSSSEGIMSKAACNIQSRYVNYCERELKFGNLSVPVIINFTYSRKYSFWNFYHCPWYLHWYAECDFKYLQLHFNKEKVHKYIIYKYKRGMSTFRFHMCIHLSGIMEYVFVDCSLLHVV
jgi:hypothetical protein